jgi:hypothetical protein
MEVGFELLYWIPYVRAQLAKFRIPKERVIAISRGGAESWYEDIAGQYLDVLDCMSEEEFRAWTSPSIDSSDVLDDGRKPFRADDFELDVLRRVPLARPLYSYQVLLPSAMFSAFRNVWRSRFSASALEEHLKPALLKSPHLVKLPFKGPYVAVKFYHSATFPCTYETKALTRELIEKLARTTTVVVLSNAGRLDDHETYGLATESTCHVIDGSELYSSRNNLAVQTALIAGADSLHCTYGGFSYLGPLLGVDTLAYTQSWAFNFTHLELAWRSFAKINAGQLAITGMTNKANSLLHAEARLPKTENVTLVNQSDI